MISCQRSSHPCIGNSLLSGSLFGEWRVAVTRYSITFYTLRLYVVSDGIPGVPVPAQQLIPDSFRTTSVALISNERLTLTLYRSPEAAFEPDEARRRLQATFPALKFQVSASSATAGLPVSVVQSRKRKTPHAHVTPRKHSRSNPDI